MVSDSEGCIVIEQMKDGLKVYENPYGVLTNNPPFHYQITNITNYRNLTPEYVESRFSDKISLGQYDKRVSFICRNGGRYIWRISFGASVRCWS